MSDPTRCTLSNGVEMPTVGLGVMHLFGRECERAIQSAFETGYRLVDTAEIYGNEREVGRAVRNSGIPREDIFVTTKLWVQYASYAHAKEGYRRSLHDLGLDYVDLLLIHQPLGDIYGAWRAMEELYEAGDVRAIGVSNLNPGRLVDLSMHNRVSPQVNQVEIHPFYQQDQALGEMRSVGCQPQGWAPFAEGRDGIFTNPVLSAIAKAHGKTVAQVILRWNVQRGVAVVPKSSKPSRIAENYDIWDFCLSAKEMEAIRSLDRGKELFFEHDSADLARRFGSYRIR